MTTIHLCIKYVVVFLQLDETLQFRQHNEHYFRCSPSLDVDLFFTGSKFLLSSLDMIKVTPLLRLGDLST